MTRSLEIASYLRPQKGMSGWVIFHPAVARAIAPYTVAAGQPPNMDLARCSALFLATVWNRQGRMGWADLTMSDLMDAMFVSRRSIDHVLSLMCIPGSLGVVERETGGRSNRARFRTHAQRLTDWWVHSGIQPALATSDPASQPLADQLPRTTIPGAAGTFTVDGPSNSRSTALPAGEQTGLPSAEQSTLPAGGQTLYRKKEIKGSKAELEWELEPNEESAHAKFADLVADRLDAFGARSQKAIESCARVLQSRGFDGATFDDGLRAEARYAAWLKANAAASTVKLDLGAQGDKLRFDRALTDFAGYLISRILDNDRFADWRTPAAVRDWGSEAPAVRHELAAMEYARRRQYR